jgi:DNA-3-methyladenine glycosylase II
MPQAELDIIAPYNFDLSMRFAVACRFESNSNGSHRALQRLLLINGIPVLAEITVDRDVEHPQASVSWSFPGGGKVARADVLRACRRMLSADLDLSPFYDLAEDSKPVIPIVREFRGLKPILTPTVFESAALAIMSQQVNLGFAHTLKMRVIDEYGEKISIDGREHTLFPSPRTLSRAKITDLKRLRFSTRKAEYLTDLARAIENGHHDLESLSDLSYEDALGRLVSIRGFGIWSANYILMRGAGHLNCLPLGDSGLHRAVQQVYELKSIPDNDRVEKLARKFAPYRSLYTLYLWYALIRELEEV